MTSAPVRFEPAMEKIGDEEAKTNAGLIETITKIQTTVFDDSGHAKRGGPF